MANAEDLAMARVHIEARKLGAKVDTYLGATDVILPRGKHFLATGTQLVSGQPMGLLEDIAAGIEDCDESCDHFWIDSDVLIALAEKFDTRH